MMILANLSIYTEQGLRKNSCLIIQNNKIHAIESVDVVKQFPAAQIIEFPETYHLVPGFIDLHVHGVNGSDVMDATPDALQNISNTLAKEGTTGFLAATMTASLEKIEQTLLVAGKYRQEPQTGAALFGVHLEGPFLAPSKVGAQRDDDLLTPKKEYIERWQELSNDAIKLVTLAPELPNSLAFIRYLKQKNIIASIGHSDATYAQCLAAIEAGCSHMTHLFNAMRGIHQREPGVVTAGLLADEVLAELIVDGVHLHPAIVELALRVKGKNKIALVTDSMRAKCLAAGVYELGGQAVTVKDDVACLENGVLAGSVLKMNSAVKNLVEFTGCSLADAVQMAAGNPARALGMFGERGSIALGKAADLVVLDEDLRVVLTLVGGVVTYSAET